MKQTLPASRRLFRRLPLAAVVIRPVYIRLA